MSNVATHMESIGPMQATHFLRNTAQVLLFLSWIELSYYRIGLTRTPNHF